MLSNCGSWWEVKMKGEKRRKRNSTICVQSLMNRPLSASWTLSYALKMRDSVILANPPPFCYLTMFPKGFFTLRAVNYKESGLRFSTKKAIIFEFQCCSSFLHLLTQTTPFELLLQHFIWHVYCFLNLFSKPLPIHPQSPVSRKWWTDLVASWY